MSVSWQFRDTKRESRCRTRQSHIQIRTLYRRTVNKMTWSNPRYNTKLFYFSVWVFETPNERVSIYHERECEREYFPEYLQVQRATRTGNGFNKIMRTYGGPKGSNTNQFTKTQISFPKHKSVYQNTNQFLKTQISLPKHKTISLNTNQFSKTQISLPKHKSISQNTNQFTKTQNNFFKYKPIFQNTNQFTKTQINFTKHKPISQNTNQKTGLLLCHY